MDISHNDMDKNSGALPPFGELLRQQAARIPQRIYAAIDDEELGYGELHARSAAVARGMAALGMMRGDRIASPLSCNSIVMAWASLSSTTFRK